MIKNINTEAVDKKKEFEMEVAASVEEGKKRRGRRPMTEEEKAAKKAEREALKAAIAEANATDKVEEAPKKRGRRKKSENATDDQPIITKSVEPEKGTWNTDAGVFPVGMQFMTVEIEFLEKVLGTSPNNEEIFSEFIASKAPTSAISDQEVEELDPVEAFEKGTTIFPKSMFIKDENGKYWDVKDISTPKNPDGSPSIEGGEFTKLPFFYNYQIRGMFKNACSMLSRAAVIDENGKKHGTTSAGIKAYKKIIDGNIFVFPRRIAVDMPKMSYDDLGQPIPTYDENGNLQILQRPLRVQTPKGDRSALAASEVIPAGSRLKFTIGYMNPSYRDAVIEWLNYGLVHGLGQWHNSGIGTFRWREIDTENQLIAPASVDQSEG